MQICHFVYLFLALFVNGVVQEPASRVLARNVVRTPLFHSLRLFMLCLPCHYDAIPGTHHDTGTIKFYFLLYSLP